jgi:EAL domain-containing protein (putative c-di-GMP-specific phosphodiesterase class I)
MDRSNRNQFHERRKPGTQGISAETSAVHEMKQALDRGEFLFYYQPKVSLVSGRMTGAEALLRWRKPDGSMVYPNEFIPIAESTGFINEITIGMLDRLVEDLALIRAVGEPLSVALNASARDFEDDRFVDVLLTLVDAGQISARDIQVEVTESAALSANAALLARLERLRARGIGLAMDDFGAGYASIDSLSHLPFSSVKLDNGVVRRMGASDKDANIVQSSVRMAHRLGLEVIAEGVETEIAYRQLQSAGCSHAQGYWIGRPMPLDDFLALASAGVRWPEGVLGLVYMATLDHLEWRKRMIDKLLLMHQEGLGMSDEEARRCEVDAADCRLGRWYHGAGRQLSGLPEYDELGSVHTALHACARRIVVVMRTGAAFSEAVPLFRELSGLSVGVIGSLQSLELAVLERNLANLPLPEAEKFRSMECSAH